MPYNERITVCTHAEAQSLSGRPRWIAFVHVGKDLHAMARGRDEGAAVADAVAKFRMARYDRKQGLVTSARTR